MLILKYLALYAYILIDVGIFGFLFPRFIGKEFSRKITHILLAGLWILIDIFFKGEIHMVIFTSSIIVINLLAYIFGFDKTIEREGEKKHPGIVYFALGITAIYVIAYFFPQFYPYTAVSVVCLTFGDGFAAIIGQVIKSKKILEHKSISGSIACVIASFIGLVAFKYIFFNELSFLTIILISILCAIFELFEKGFDNISITIGCLFLSYFINTLDISFSIGIIIAIATFVWVFFAGLITYYGALLSGIYIVFFYYYGGISHLLILFLCYLFSVIIHVIRKKMKVDTSDIVDKEHKKDFMQILANGIFGLVPCIIFAFTHNDIFLIISGISICASFVDSISSDIGTMSKKMPYDIFKRRYVEKGLSGGVSLLGTLAALIYSIMSAVYIVLIYKLNLWYIVFVTLLIMSNTIIDTTLGSLVQAKYKCIVCDKFTEKKIHCSQQTILSGGLKIFNNDIVNLTSAFLTFVISLIVFILK